MMPSNLCTPFRFILRAAIACMALAVVLSLSPSALASCGDGVLDAGEQCDDGSGSNGGNGTTNSCCASNCTFAPKSPDVIVGDLVGRSGPYRICGTTCGPTDITAFAV